MSTIDTGGPAFPLQSIGPEFAPGYAGMTLRDYFAAKAMQGLLCKGATLWPFGADESDDPTDALLMARTAYQIADALLAARKAGT